MAKSDDNNLDKGRIRRRSSNKGQGPGARKEGQMNRLKGMVRNPFLSTSSPDGHHRAEQGTRRRGTRRREKKQHSFRNGTRAVLIERQMSTPTIVRLFPYERTVRASRKPRVPRRSVGGKRGPIVKFTEDAQRGLRRALHSLTGLYRHIVLTYPGQFPRRGDEAKKHLQAFYRWVKSFKIGRHLGDGNSNSEERPHFHLLLNGYLNAKSARAKWVEIIGASALFPSSCALRAEPIYDQHRIRSYVAKRSDKDVPCGFDAVRKILRRVRPCDAHPNH